MPSEMRALIYQDTRRMEYTAAARPAAAADETLLKVLFCGICGSDRHAYHGKDPRRVPPLVLGHEAVGEDDSGARFIVNPLITCGQCAACLRGSGNLCAKREMISMARAGAFADMLAMPKKNLLPLPKGLSAQDGALAEPAACAWRLVTQAVRRLPLSPACARCLVIGAGAIGILTALSLRAVGCRHVLITDAQPARCAAAEGIGLPAVLAADLNGGANNSASSAAGANGTNNTGEYDLIADAVGAPATRRLACARAAAGGVIAHIGLEDGGEGLDARRLTLYEINFTGTYTYTPAEFAAAVQLLAEGVFDKMRALTECRPLAQGAAAFADLDAGAAAAKILLQP